VRQLEWTQAQYLLAWREGTAVGQWLESGRNEKINDTPRPDGRRTSYAKRTTPRKPKAKAKD